MIAPRWDVPWGGNSTDTFIQTIAPKDQEMRLALQCTSWICMAITTIFFILRVVVKVNIQKNILIEDGKLFIDSRVTILFDYL